MLASFDYLLTNVQVWNVLRFLYKFRCKIWSTNEMTTEWNGEDGMVTQTGRFSQYILYTVSNPDTSRIKNAIVQVYAVLFKHKDLFVWRRAFAQNVDVIVAFSCRCMSFTSHFCQKKIWVIRLLIRLCPKFILVYEMLKAVLLSYSKLFCQP